MSLALTLAVLEQVIEDPASLQLSKVVSPDEIT